MRKTIQWLLPALLVFAACGNNPYAELDEVLEQKEEIDRMLRERTDSLRQLLDAASTEEQRWERAEALYMEWRHLNLDSCAHYTAIMQETAGGDRSRILRSQAALIRNLVRAGNIPEALQMFLSLDLPEDASLEDCVAYYYSADRLTSQLPRAVMDTLSPGIDRITEDYLRRVGPTVKARLFRVKALRYLNKLDEAIAYEKAIPLEDVTDVYDLSTYYMCFCTSYLKIGDRKTAIAYATKAAVVDIRNGMRDYFSLFMLGRMLFQEGDATRAGRYMNRAVQDALEYNYPAGLKRSARVSAMLNETIQSLHHRQRIQMEIGIFVISSFLIAALLLLFLNRRMLARVRQANRMYEESQMALRSVSNIKDKMLGEYMELSSNYIYKVDENKSRYRRILKEQGAEALMSIFREPTYADAEYPHYWENFDKIFLSIFPHFVERVNELMKPGHAFHTETPDSLTTQLRILALLRLGITEGERISAILHISKGTVYTYRCVIRGDALSPETFEDAVKSIPDV